MPFNWHCLTPSTRATSASRARYLTISNNAWAGLPVISDRHLTSTGVAVLRTQLRHQPCTSNFPVSFDGDNGDAQQSCDLVLQQSSEEAKLDNSGGARVGLFKFCQSLVERQHIFVLSSRIPTVNGGQGDLMPVASTLICISRSRVVD